MEVFYFLVVTLLSIVSSIYIYYKIAFNYWKSRNIPFVEPTFPFGNINGMGTHYHISQVFGKFYDQFKGNAKYCGLYLATVPSIMLLDLELIKNVLIRDFGNFPERGLYYNEKDDPLSAHLFTLDGDKWRELRAKLTSTFTSGKMKFMFPTVVQVGERFRDRLQFLVKNHDVLEMKDLMVRFSTDIIGTCAFGIECNSLNDENAEFREAGRGIFERPRHTTLGVALFANFRNLSRKLRIKLVRDDVSTFFLNIVRETVEYREKNNIQRNDFMDLLIKLKNEAGSESQGLTVDEIAAQAFIFFSAGFETTSSTLGFCLYELALNPDIQAKTRKEIQNAIKRHNGEFTYETMMDMPFVDNVINETLRKYPPVTVLIRRTQNNYKLPGTDHIIEKGTQVFIPTNAIQHDEEYFPEPEKFLPERFEDDGATKLRNSMTWLPFGDGPRNCIGLRFGMMKVRVGLAMLLNNFEFTTCEKTTIPMDVQPRSIAYLPKGGVYLKLKPIN